jgi:hypothetical protein
MRAPDYWKSHYVTSTDRAEIDLALKHARLNTDGESLELIYFLNAPDAPNVLIFQGSGGHGYVLAELAYRVHLWGFNVFVMPKHGGRTVNQLMSRHLEVLQYIRREFNDRIWLVWRRPWWICGLLRRPRTRADRQPHLPKRPGDLD